MNPSQGFRLGRMPAIPMKAALAAGLVLLVGVNAITLGLVAWNRSGEPDAVLLLGERELDRPYGWHARGSENSGLVLRLRWRVAAGPEPQPGAATDTDKRSQDAQDDHAIDPWLFGGTARWLDAAKLERLGFVFDEASLRRRTQARQVLLVVEQDGPAHRAAIERAQQRLARETALRDANPGKPEFVERAKRAAEHAQDEQSKGSRLFVVDAGLDADALRSQYPDRRRHAIVRGHVRADWCVHCQDRNLHARIERIDAGIVNVPYGLRTSMPSENIGARTGWRDEARFSAEIAFGRRLEPWMRTLVPAKDSP